MNKTDTYKVQLGAIVRSILDRIKHRLPRAVLLEQLDCQRGELELVLRGKAPIPHAHHVANFLGLRWTQNKDDTYTVEKVEEYMARFYGEKEGALPNTPTAEVIVCAAIRHRGVIYCGVRHFDCIMRSQMDAAKLAESDFVDPAEEGFVTNRREFVGRTEALRIAIGSGQLNKYRSVPIREFGLQSENLY